MNEYMFRNLNKIDHQKNWSDQKHKEFAKKCEKYIQKLSDNGHLVSAKPLMKNGVVLKGNSKSWNINSLKDKGEIQVGYYIIKAINMDKAIELAKSNPEFEYSSSARIEIRPITENEKSTGFIYPSK